MHEIDAEITDSTHRATDRDLRERSPSTGWQETAELLDAPHAHDVEPVDAAGCGALGCHTDAPLFQVPTDAGDRVLCPDHAAAALDRVRA